MKIATVGNGFAAQVSEVDLKSVSDGQLGEIKDAFSNAEVLFFLDQTLEPADQVAFAERWGEINVNRFFTPVADEPRIAEVLKEPDQTLNIGGGWHTDHSYDQVPAMGSMLYAKQIPPRGGDTLFASMTAAFAGLSKGMQEMLLGLRAVHSSRHVFGAAANYSAESNQRIGNPELATQDAVHPVIIEHPLSGKPALYVNPGFTLHFEGWTQEESQPLLQQLYAHASKPEFNYRHHWAEGCMAFWDNRATWHYALNDYHGQRRLLHRITLEGGPLKAAAH